MKRTILSLFVAVASLTAVAQTDIWYFQNGLATKVAQVDSIVFKAPVYECVDLGLSVKWAACNIGATKPYEYGAYFSWAETSPKDAYTWEDYEINSSAKYEEISEKTLNAEDDAATVRWEGSWRLPTIDEINELLNTDNCTWEWQASGNREYNGVVGYKVTSKKSGYEGNAIFLPAAGYRDDENVLNEGTQGYYWTSTRANMNPSNACCLNYVFGNPTPLYVSRFCGITVRPVCP